MKSGAFCINTHYIEEEKDQYCTTCGEKVIACCPTCKEKIRPVKPVSSLATLGMSPTPRAPKHCHKCGYKFPWKSVDDQTLRQGIWMPVSLAKEWDQLPWWKRIFTMRASRYVRLKGEEAND